MDYSVLFRREQRHNHLETSSQQVRIEGTTLTRYQETKPTGFLRAQDTWNPLPGPAFSDRGSSSRQSSIPESPFWGYQKYQLARYRVKRTIQERIRVIPSKLQPRQPRWPSISTLFNLSKQSYPISIYLSRNDTSAAISIRSTLSRGSTIYQPISLVFEYVSVRS